jgi:hypothetical protein
MSSTLVDILGPGNPSAPALIVGSGGPEFTRQQVHQAAVQVAHTLRSSGVSSGDVVTIAESNTVDNVVIFLGVTYARAVAAPLNQNYTQVTHIEECTPKPWHCLSISHPAPNFLPIRRCQHYYFIPHSKYLLFPE